MGWTWRIGEVAERTGLTRRTLRHYDDLGLLVPSARSWGDYRLYDEADLLRLLQIQNLKALGLSLPEIAEALADPDLDAAATLRSHLAALEDRIAAEQALAQRLRRLADASERSWEEVLAAIALTQDLAHPDPVVRLRAALRSPGTTADILTALDAETEPGVRDTLVWALAQRPDAAPVARERLSSTDPLVRVAMVRVLGKLRDTTAVPALIPLLTDPHPQVVSAVVDVLGRLGDPAAVEPLAALLGSDVVEPLDVTEALGAFGPDAVPSVAERLRTGSVAVRQQAAEVLGRLGSPAAVPALQAALADPEVALAALLALGELGPAARPAIERALADSGLAGVARRLLDLSAT
jgi:DNA-binding transcriptional MerR regulator